MAQTLDLPEGRIDYDDRGTGRPIVTVHGYLMGGDLWDELAELLVARGHRVITPTWTLGAHRHALAAAADRTPLGQAARIAAFLEALDLHDVVLVGNDSGGALCQLVAAHHPERIGALVLTDCDVFENFPPSFFKLLVRMARSKRVFGGIARLVQSGRARRGPLGYGLLSHTGVDDRAAEWVRPILEDHGVREDTRLLTVALRSEVLRAAEPALRRFPKPVLVAWATDDKLFPMRDAHVLVDVFSDARLATIEGSRTFSMVDQPDRLAELVDNFVRELQPTP